MHWFYASGYDYGRGIPGLPSEIHGFVLNKPTAIRNSLVRDGVVTPNELHVPQPIHYEDLKRVHNEILIEALNDPEAVARAIELDEIAFLPEEVVKKAVVEPQLLASGGTYEALRLAMQGEWAVNLSGGYHHARESLSHGFCLINDVATGLARLRHEGLRRRVLIIDLDLHQGDGNATIFRDDADVYTVSIHEEGIFPLPKMRSDLDIGLPADTEDADYLAAVEEALRHVQGKFSPDVIVYVAGTDPYFDDPLGSLRVTKNALMARDRRVAEFAAATRSGFVVLPAGGYTPESPGLSAAGFAAVSRVAVS